MSRDYNQFPDDENGNVLWQMHQDGDDLQEAHEIEFLIAFADEAQADRCALHLLKEEQKISLFQDEDSDTLEWIITIYVYMEPAYEDIVDLEQWFSKIAAQFQGEYDGWGCMAYVYDDELDDEESSLRSS
ncbi:ribonuclease E inhibitor RraB [Acinetobacter lwoffii]|uniref:Ribonuclease E inhibitor RraB n=1 Tax=Acinetobacter lwoffii TaxID=28090 RepID=A0AAJ3E3R7_ACILW|nr:ribonuclease E inhibitor RraB [Acinetobacter lwoffii]MCU4615053.1 ribonuclease E inhibitor RraB [Acinetobacter lwoffii]NKS46502.1 ribonuclease E inhibitor RraB [Acinetobacter lwoffii]QXR08126.1 ribonuclease E inhibitor RraB [Acinetobacter lwoffii]